MNRRDLFGATAAGIAGLSRVASPSAALPGVAAGPAFADAGSPAAAQATDAAAAQAPPVQEAPVQEAPVHEAPVRGPVLPAGAPADGASHPLSARFADLDAARRAYPAATSLDDEADWCALQGAVDEAAHRGSGAVYVPNTGRAYVLNRTLRVNPNRVTLRGDGATLDFASLRGAEAALLFDAADTPPYGHERHVFEGFELVGPGREDHAAGLLFRTPSDVQSSRALLRDCTIHGFYVGALFGDNAYALGFTHVSIYDCHYCVHAPAGLWNAGESVSFSQCYLFNSFCLVSNPGAFDLRFFGCSLDYGGRFVWQNRGGIDFVGCRLEMAPPREPPVQCEAGGRVNLFGGFLLINGARDEVFAPEFFALGDPRASVHLFSVAGWNWRTTTGKLTNGPGRVFLHAGSAITEAPGDVGHP